MPLFATWKKSDATEKHTFTKHNIRNPFFNLTLPEHTTPIFADLDNDGDLDMHILTVNATFSTLLQYENTGNTTFPIYSKSHLNTLFQVAETGQSSGLQYATFGDVDDDGDLDALCSYSTDTTAATKFLNNTGNISTPNYQVSGYNPAANIKSSKFLFVNLGSGIELMAGGYGGQWGSLYKDVAFFGGNVGQNFSLRDKFAFGAGNTPGPTFGDFDNDGDVDVLVHGADGGGTTHFLKLFENTGNQDMPIFTERSTVVAPSDLVMSYDEFLPILTDLDGDGDGDLVVSWRRGVDFYENKLDIENQQFTEALSTQFSPMVSGDVCAHAGSVRRVHF